MIKKLSATLTCLAGDMDEDGNEMEYIQIAFKKMGGLLTMVYGEAGADTLRNNIVGEATGIDPNVRGKMIDGIFGFCDIREFTAATECLREDVMLFVNKVGQIVHDIVVANGGFPNKNVGDAFLVVWRPPEGGLAAIADMEPEDNIADKALTAICTSAEYCNYDSELLKLLEGNAVLQKRMPGFRVKIGFGLHAGWAIEGAIGSAKKVDCSYLGPQQDMAERLETATKIYGTGLLVTHMFYDLLSKERKRLMRTVDVVLCHKMGGPGTNTELGASIPIRLYAVSPGIEEGDYLVDQKNQYTMESEAGLNAYIAGDWSAAAKTLGPLLAQNPNDHPVKFIVDYMKEVGPNAPSDWPGYRIVSEDLPEPFETDV